MSAASKTHHSRHDGAWRGSSRALHPPMAASGDGVPGRPSPWRPRLHRIAGHARLAFLASHVALCSAQTVTAAQPGGGADAFAVQSRIGRGVNVLSSDPMWNGTGQERFRTVDFARIRAGGFRTVRINLQAFRHMDADGRLEGRWLETLDRMVAAALKARLITILDEHDFVPCSLAPRACFGKLEAFWRQIERRYHRRGRDLLFELENEPHDPLTPPLWNRLASRIIALVRRRDRNRVLVVGPGSYNDGRLLDRLRLPERDRNIIVTVHYYRPMRFTHQGAPWNGATAGLHGIHWGSRDDLRRLEADFDGIDRWARLHRRPILLGEFGAFEAAPLASRVAYDAAVARAAERRSWAWCYWQFDGDFIVYDVERDAWVAPIWHALVPPAPPRARPAGASPARTQKRPSSGRTRQPPAAA